MRLEDISIDTPARRMYYNKLPYNPYAMERKGLPARTMPLELATEQRYIQHNPPCSANSIVIDVDELRLVEKQYKGFGVTGVLKSNYKACEIGLSPNVIIKNRDNNKGHLVYYLETPVHKNSFSRKRPLLYLAEVEKRLTVFLGGDKRYANFLSKNALHDDYEVFYTNAKQYQLEDFLKLPEVREETKEIREIASGRNVEVFEKVRKIAYSLYSNYSYSYDEFFEVVLAECAKINDDFRVPLNFSEIKATAKSITNYCVKKISKKSRSIYISKRATYFNNLRTEKADNALYDDLVKHYSETNLPLID